MRGYILLLALLCTFLFGSVGGVTGFGYLTMLLFLASLSVLAYTGLYDPDGAGLSGFDRLTYH